MILQIYRSSIGQKWIVALTGLMLIGFVTGHMIGNLQVFLHPDWINAYAKHLEDLGPLLWIIRLALLAIFALHIVTTIKLTLENRRARPERYAVRAPQRSTLASRSMALSGLLVLSFVLYHLMHFTVRAQHPQWNEESYNLHGEMVRDVHRMIIEGFQNPVVAGFYILSVFLLALHLSHGFSSFFQTLGLNSRKLNGILSAAGKVYAWGLFLGYAAIPVAVLTNVLK